MTAPIPIRPPLRTFTDYYVEVISVVTEWPGAAFTLALRVGGVPRPAVTGDLNLDDSATVAAVVNRLPRRYRAHGRQAVQRAMPCRKR